MYNMSVVCLQRHEMSAYLSGSDNLYTCLTRRSDYDPPDTATQVNAWRPMMASWLQAQLHVNKLNPFFASFFAKL